MKQPQEVIYSFKHKPTYDALIAIFEYWLCKSLTLLLSSGQKLNWQQQLFVTNVTKMILFTKFNLITYHIVKFSIGIV